MFRRIALENLREWALKAERKPLVLRGARQVGKTTLVEMFAADFDHYIYLNLEEKDNAELFATDSTFDDLLAGIFFKAKLPVDSPRTLIFIDEQTDRAQGRASSSLFLRKAPRPICHCCRFVA